ncbi:ABC transporter permease subunit [Streptomyces nymphaeiformis]|uniref:ABC-type branched-subunit amino acid transport system ATPase component/ABC-type branched-subunit amino acid transport system permease subunit n=1 Tax=Streptomyces nymphaeiformis TaxID=2663842 RepID=A0A7W7TX24_9ACTN|nr:ATP-binding cassette domain-containing protein [Streptomyces nymphaeiformis]MBB4980965.1 ABC-type branched-subunit amino acid transport system ATPase component/ABC-type branched-subunit amino acid transport system permease subunit [Streptomyces nymphaeiformis]
MISLTRQLAVDGLVDGLVIGLLAMGVVLVHRSTRVINFAVANMGLVGSALFSLLAVRYGVPFWPALLISLVAGTAFGAVVDLAVVRRLFAAPRVILLVATIGVAQLAQVIVTAYPEVDAAKTYPVWSSSTWHPLHGVDVTAAQIAVLAVVPLVVLALNRLLGHTVLGRAATASADNPELARLNGISPKVVSTAVWALAGLLATICMILISSRTGSVTSPAALGPTTLMRALAAAAIARMYSFHIALLAGIGLGLLQAVIQFNWLDRPGLTDVIVFALVLVAVFAAGRGRDAENATFSFAPKRRPVPERLRELWWVRNLERFGLAALGVVAIAIPLVVAQPSKHLLYTVILAYAICAASVTVLTGWAGQLSLGQMAFAGIGALTAAALSRGLRLDIGGEKELVLDRLTFPTAVALAALLTAALAALIGVGALRVRGLLLAVSTIAFAVTCEQWVFRQDVFHDGPTQVTASFSRGHVLGIDVSSQRSYSYVVLAVLVVVLVVTGRLRRTGVGRTTIGVRDNPATAAAYTVRAARVKLRAFALAGGVAGLGGALLAGALQSVPYTDAYFRSQDSLMLVSVVVIGGIGSTSGPVLGALWVIGLPAFFPGNALVPLLASSMGLLLLLLYFPGGLVQIGYSARDALLGWAERRLGPPPADPVPSAPQVLTRPERDALPEDRPVLAIKDIHVRFGGVTAVSGVSLDVRPHEIVGLIGTNGAGKSTLMNAIGGFVPAAGTVALLGREVSGTHPAARAALGLGRTFQAATLFPELTVRETVQIALEARGRSGLLSSALWLPRSVKGERAKRAEARELIDFLGLGRHADTLINDLSTGTRRIVELAGLLALDARLLCLDEPTAGVAQRETEAFGPLILEIRRELGASMLVIEHDMPLIMGISDRVYCLETGRVIAEGTPDAVRHDPRVVAGYLGTDERAIARSGSSATP